MITLAFQFTALPLQPAIGLLAVFLPRMPKSAH
jgi:hypothetical protein